MKDVPSVDELTGLIVETVRRNGFREDAYIRPSFYKSTRQIGVRLHHLEHELYIVALPFGNYIDTEAGVRVMTSSWRRNADEALPARGKIVGGYVNMAFQKSEAELNGFDEAIVLTADGHVNEASAANVFVVRDGVALTPPVSDDLLEGVTRKAIMELLANEGIPVEIRSIDRSELYIADEVFLCGTGVQVSPVIEVDHRPVGSGEIGPITRLIRDRYFDAVRGRLPEYAHWLTPTGNAAEPGRARPPAVVDQAQRDGRPAVPPRRGRARPTAERDGQSRRERRLSRKGASSLGGVGFLDPGLTADRPRGGLRGRPAPAGQGSSDRS